MTVGQDGIKEATVAIFGLRNVEDRSVSVNPTNVSGDISVILDVQPNDETVTSIALTLGDEVIQCRGTSTDADPMAGLAESGGSVEVDCFFDTNAVMGECTGMQLDPMFANGDHHLGAYVMTDAGEKRSVVATQAIKLTNNGFVMIAHAPGSMSLVSDATKGLTFYGGPATEGNVNMFHACPVAYDGTMVGELTLSTKLTDTDQAEITGDDAPAKATFRAARSGPAYPADKEAPFTWSMLTTSWSGNTSVENVPGENEHWVVNSGQIKNPDGLDVTSTFRMEGAMAMKGPLHFDFRAPRLNDGGNSEVKVSANFGDGLGRTERPIVDGQFYSDGSSSTPARLVVSNVAEMGVKGINEVIAVGDCSVDANTDSRASTAFVPGDGMADVRNLSELPEDDGAEGLSDDGGLDCYFAELQELHDALGNATWLGNTRIQSANPFGIDHTPPEISDLEPDEAGLVVNDTHLDFSSEDPDLATGEEGSGTNGFTTQRYFSGAWRSTNANVRTQAYTSAGNYALNVSALDDGSHSVRSISWDNALPANGSVAAFSFIRDTKVPTFTAGAGPGAVSAGSSPSIQVTATGVIKDANVIDEALLTVWSNGGSPDVCGMANGGDSGDAMLSRSRARPYDLENDSKTIEFSQTVTVGRSAAGGVEDLCFQLEVKDIAVNAQGDDSPNTMFYSAGRFSVNWGLGATVDSTTVSPAEGAGGTTTYSVKLDAMPTDTVRVRVRSSDTTAVTASAGNGDGMTTSGAGYLVFHATGDENATGWYATPQTVTYAAPEDDDNADNERVTISHTAAGGGYDGVSIASVTANVMDNDGTLSLDDMSVAEGATDTVTVTVTLATAAPAGGTTVTVTYGEDNAAAATLADVGTGSRTSITVQAGATVGTTMVSVAVGDMTGSADQTIVVTATIGGSQIVLPVAGLSITLVNDDE